MRNERVVVYVRTETTTMRFFFLLSKSSHEARRLVRECWYRAYIFAYIQLYNVGEREWNFGEREKRAKRIAFIHIEISLVKLSCTKCSQYVFLRSHPTHTAYAHRTDTSTHGEAPHKYFAMDFVALLFFSSFFYTPQPTRPCAVCATTAERSAKEKCWKRRNWKEEGKKTVRESTEHRDDKPIFRCRYESHKFSVFFFSRTTQQQQQHRERRENGTENCIRLRSLLIRDTSILHLI